ncbi:acyltransferase [Nocardioides mangrovicus]|uniref:Acyltransferase n=2 Tax=Nocardioides mangrovicus TaxID=2478913 RepID=A0A3L8P220_9ACTN|nr:acyltransferase [Nocardioides mangrovicus]
MSRAGRHVGRRARWMWAVTGSAGEVTGRCELGPRSHVSVTAGGMVRLGRRIVVASDFEAYVQGELVVGDDVYIGRWCLLSAFESIRIGSRVRLGERVSIHDENHSSTGDDYVAAPVIIEDGAWIGAGAIVLPGVRIGEGAVVGAGSVVTRSVEPFTVVAGAPARPVATDAHAGTDTDVARR